MMRIFFLAATLLFPAVLAGPAKAEVRMSGSFVARTACPARPSIHSDRNPGDVSLETNRSYELLAKNKDEASHYLIEIPEAEPPRRWVGAECGDLSAVAPTGAAGSVETVSAAADPLSADKPSYLLVASWEPAFCETKPNKRECRTETPDRFDATHFALHGLWPQPKGRQFCNVAPDIKKIALTSQFDRLPPLNLSEAVRRSLDEVMPGTESALERHEWFRHGTCVKGATPDSYFASAIALMAQLNASPLRDLFARSVGRAITSAQIKNAMDESFGAGAGDRVQVQCESVGADDAIQELWIGLAGDVSVGSSLAQLIAAARPLSVSCESGVIETVAQP